MKRYALALAATLALTAGTASASHGNFAPSLPGNLLAGDAYFGVGVGVDGGADDTFTFKLYAGEQLTNAYAFEISYHNLGTQPVLMKDPGGAGRVEADYKVHALQVGFTGRYHPTLQTDLIGRLGLAYIFSAADDTGFGDKHSVSPTVGAGVQFKINPNVSITVDGDVFLFDFAESDKIKGVVNAGILVDF